MNRSGRREAAGWRLWRTPVLAAALTIITATISRADGPPPWREVNRRATQAIHLGQFAAGESLALNALRDCAASGAEEVLCASISLQNAADGAAGLGRPGDAESDLRRALAIRRTGLAPGHPLIADEELRLGMLLYRQHRPAEAEPLFADAAAIVRQVGPDGTDRLIVILSWDENALLALGRTTDALTPAAEAQTLATQVHGATSEPALLAVTNRISILRRADLSDQALDVALSALSQPGIEAVAPHWRLMLAGQAAQAAHEIGRPDPTRTVATAALKLAASPGTALPGAESTASVTLFVGLSRLALDAGDDAGALAYADRAVALAGAVVPSEAGVTLLERGLARLALGDAAGALPDLDAALPRLPGPASLADRIRAVTAVVRATTALGDPAGAQARLETALAAETAAPPATQGILRSYLATTYLALGDPARAAVEQGHAVALLQGAPGFEAPLIAAYRSLAVMRLNLNDVAGAQEAANLAIAVTGDTPAIAQERPAAFAIAARAAAYGLQVPQGLLWAQQAATLVDALHADARQAVALGTLAAFYATIARTPSDGARAAAFAARARTAYGVLGVHDDTLAAVTRAFGEARIWQQRAAEGEALCRDAAAQYRNLPGTQAVELARTASCIGWAQYAQGAFAAAEKTLADGVALLRDQPRADPTEIAELADRHGLALRDLGRLDEARETLMAARDEMIAGGAGGTLTYAGLLASLGSVLRRTDDVAAARAIDAQALSLLDRIGPGGGDSGLIRAAVLVNEGQIAEARGQKDLAARLLEQATQLRRDRMP